MMQISDVPLIPSMLTRRDELGAASYYYLLLKKTDIIVNIQSLSYASTIGVFLLWCSGRLGSK